MATKQIFDDLNLVIRLNQHIEDITSSEAATQALLNRESSFQVLAELGSIATPDARVEAQFDHQRADFRAQADASSLPFHLQGDQSFNDAAVLAKRRHLRHSEAIKSRIAFLWRVAQGHGAADLARVSSATARTRPEVPAAAAASPIDERAYTAMMLLVFKVLREDFVLDAAKRQIQCDWEVDSHHGQELTYEQFYAALFELVDVWTCDVLEATYVRFLELLARRITLRVVVFLDDMKLKLALSDNFDDAVVVKAIPLSTIKKFASVAKLMEDQGIKTIGELAAADPQVVERQRVAYLERHSTSQVKIGGDVQALLAMFREVSQQFQGSTYALNNSTLQRVNATQATHRPERQSETRAAMLLGSVGSHGDTAVHETLVGGRLGDNCSGFGLGQEGHLVSEPLHDTVGSHKPSDPDSPEGQQNPPSNLSGGGVLRTGAWTRLPHGLGGAVPIDPPRQGDVSVPPILRRGIKRINTFHDLSITDTGVIDALKATFLIEKGISLQRKTSLLGIQDELRKFGVDIDASRMREEELIERYHSLYEMFVLRDGDNIRSLAQSVLARIKMELAAHGIEVNDEDAESMYDGFYGTIVVGSGEAIVSDAKSWVDETVRNKGMGNYIKHDYHELKPIDEVNHVGKDAGDEEFASLLATDEESDDGALSAETHSAENASGSPTGLSRRQSLSRRPSLYRPQGSADQCVVTTFDDHEIESVLAHSHNQPSPQSVDCSSNRHDSDIVHHPSMLSPASRSTNDENDVVPVELHSLPFNESSGNETSFSPHMVLFKTDNLILDGIDTDRTKDVNTGDVNGPQTNTFAAAAVVTTAGDNGNIEVVSDDDAIVALSNSFDPGPIEEMPSTETPDIVVSLDKPTHVPIPPYSTNDTSLELELLQPDEIHVVNNDQERGRQGIEFEYEPTNASPEPAVKVVTEKPGVAEPKIPDIIVSGVDSAQHIHVAARYIQLLGLGNVAVIRPEKELLQAVSDPCVPVDLLCFDVGAEIDRAADITQTLCHRIGRRIILFGGDEFHPDRTREVADICVSLGAVYFAHVPLDFPELRSRALAFFEAAPQPYIIRQRRGTGATGTASKLAPVSIRAANMMSIDDDLVKRTATPPQYADSTKASKRKATTTLPSLVTVLKESSSATRSRRTLDDMTSVDTVNSFSPVIPSSPKGHKNSPRLSATLKKLMR